jgi:hypothetical protein
MMSFDETMDSVRQQHGRDQDAVGLCDHCGEELPCLALQAVSWAEYEHHRARRFLKTNREGWTLANNLRRQRLALLEIITGFIEPSDLPLWKRIGNQRLAIRDEIRTRGMYERITTSTREENKNLRKRIEELEAQKSE